MTTVKAAALQGALDDARLQALNMASQPDKRGTKRKIDVALLRDMLMLIMSALDALDGESTASDDA